MTLTVPSMLRIWCGARRSAEGMPRCADKPVLHGDNGATLKATTVLAMLHWLGIKPSYSRPRVSDDNAYAEALFRTAKYRPEFPAKGFADLDAAGPGRAASCIGTTTSTATAASATSAPAQRHAGQDRAMLAARHARVQHARQRNPPRWSGPTRNWTPVGAVTLNPERDSVVAEHQRGLTLRQRLHEPRGDNYLDTRRLFKGRPFRAGEETSPSPTKEV